MKNTDKVTLSFGQLKKLISEASIFNVDNVVDGNKLVKEAIKKIEETTHDAETIQKLQEQLKMFTAKAVEQAREAKAEKSAADALVKKYSKPLDDAAKSMAEIIGTSETVFFSAIENGRKVGLILNYAKKPVSQEDAYKEIFKLLQSPKFVAQHEKLHGLSKHMIAILQDALNVLKEMGLFEPDQIVRKAQGLYSLEPGEDEFQPLKEGLFGGIGEKFISALKKIGDWFTGFINKFTRHEERYVEELEEWNDYLIEIKNELKNARISESKKAKKFRK